MRLCLYDDADTRDKVQHASDLCFLLGAEHQHIDAGRQTVQFERVLEDLVAGMTGKGKCPGVFFQQGGRFLNLPQVFLPVDIQLGITRQRGAIDMHGQAFDVAQVGQVNHLRLVHLLYRCGDVHLIARIVQRSPFVAQLISALPSSPALQRLFQPLVFLGSGKAVVPHQLIALDSYLASLRQIAIYTDE